MTDEYLKFLFDIINSTLKELKRVLENMEIITPFDGIDIERTARKAGICYVCFQNMADNRYDGICPTCFDLEIMSLYRKEGKWVG